MRNLFSLAAFSGIAFKCVLAATVTAVDESEVEAALNTCPPRVEDSVLIDRVGSEGIGHWISSGRVVGETVFADEFKKGIDASRWQATVDGTVTARENVEGTRCVEFTPPEASGWAFLRLHDGGWLPFDADRPCAVLWEALSPDNGLLMLRVDFKDAEGRDLKPSFQVASTLNPTQPTIFQRNAVLVNPKAPKGAAQMRIYFHVGSRANGGKTAYLAGVRTVDFSRRLRKYLELARVDEDRRKAAESNEVLVYCADNVTGSYPLMPAGRYLPGMSVSTLALRECPGETARATMALWSKRAWKNVTVRFDALVRTQGGEISSARLKAKVVKCHYQAHGAPDGFLAGSGDPVLVPELLLNDENVVVVDHAGKRNLLRCRDEGRAWHVDTSTLRVPKWNFPVPTSLMPAADAKALKPFALKAEENKQLVLKVAVPADAQAGVYSGAVRFSAEGREIAKRPITLEVLPFPLPKRAETAYDPSRDYTMGLYVWARLSDDGAPYLSPMHRSREQLTAEYRLLVEHGVTLPAFIWGRSIVCNESRFREHLAIVREAGFPGKTLLLASSDLLGNSTDEAKLERLKAEIVQWRKVAGGYGFEELYCYGLDEAKGAKLVSQRAAWVAAKAAGAKVFVSGYSGHFAAVGDILDLCIFAEAPERADPADWHRNGARLWKYNSPQTGPENPMIFRRNYGLPLWRRGYDGGCTYCDVGGAAYWNDLADRQRRQREGKPTAAAYRSHTIMYPTVDGAIETLALIGLGDAIKDVRYMTKFLQCFRRNKNPAAKAWLKSIDFGADDPAQIRQEAINWILKLSAQK